MFVSLYLFEGYGTAVTAIQYMYIGLCMWWDGCRRSQAKTSCTAPGDIWAHSRLHVFITRPTFGCFFCSLPTLVNVLRWVALDVGPIDDGITPLSQILHIWSIAHTVHTARTVWVGLSLHRDRRAYAQLRFRQIGTISHVAHTVTRVKSHLLLFSAYSNKQCPIRWRITAN